MKNPTFSLPGAFAVLFALVPGLLLGGVVVTHDQKIEGEGMNMDMKAKTSVQDGKMRMEVGEMSVMIMDSQAGDMVTLMPQQKMAMRITKEGMKRMAAMKTEPAAEELGDITITATGKKDTLIGHEAEEYTVKGGGMDGSIWVAKDIPGLKELRDINEKMGEVTNGGGGNPGEKMMKAMKHVGIDGYPLKSDLTMTAAGRKMHVTTTVTSVEEKDLDASLFKVPEGYQVQDLAAMLGGQDPSPAPVSPEQGDE